MVCLGMSKLRIEKIHEKFFKICFLCLQITKFAVKIGFTIRIIIVFFGITCYNNNEF